MPKRFQITHAAELEALEKFRSFIMECCSRFNIPDETVLELKLAVDEACTNVIEHGYKGMDPGSIILSFRIEADRILVQITDFGHVFELEPVPEPDLEAMMRGEEVGGLGLFLIYQTMNDINYQASEDGNTLTFTKLLKS